VTVSRLPACQPQAGLSLTVSETFFSIPTPSRTPAAALWRSAAAAADRDPRPQRPTGIMAYY
jgi:hypothetical protein